MENFILFALAYLLFKLLNKAEQTTRERALEKKIVDLESAIDGYRVIFKKYEEHFGEVESLKILESIQNKYNSTGGSKHE